MEEKMINPAQLQLLIELSTKERASHTVATQTRARSGNRSAAGACCTPLQLVAAGSRCAPRSRLRAQGGTITQPSHCRSQS
jgi:hypothetical protein